MPSSRSRSLLWLVCWVVVAAGLVFFLGSRVGGIPPLGTLLDPVDGLYRTARHASLPAETTIAVPTLEGEVTVLRDERGVPHIFAEHDADAVRAMGYVVAQDRLFQLDFIPRVASGRLASALGPGALGTDHFLRNTGMDWGARRNLDRIRAADGLEWELVNWFAEGVNAYLDGLAPADLPFEFRLLGYEPDRYTPLQSQRLLQYMTFDLSYRSDAAEYGALRERLGAAEYARLFPRHSDLYVPIMPDPGGVPAVSEPIGRGPAVAVPGVLHGVAALQRRLLGTVAEGYVHGKGSNNWAVAGSRSATGAPILAGDMHLSLTLPAIWYEVHLATPTMNTYGVTVPGAPLPVEAFNDHVAWAFTNTGSDQIDHLRLDLDEAGRRYRFEDEWRDLTVVVETLQVNGGDAVLDTVLYSHWGPVMMDGAGAVALRWVAHDSSRTLHALWGMNHAADLGAFEDALRYWDTPMQNILYADVEGNIAIRSTGHLPIRRGGDGDGVRDGASAVGEWVGRVPFEELPHALNPAQGFLTSTNQQPADSSYRYYLGHDWRDSFRSIRIDSLLRGNARHSVDDLKRYQGDVHAVQRDLFAPLLDTLSGLGARPDTLRRMLMAWDGAATVDRPEPLILDHFLDNLRALAWDEPVFNGLRRPSLSVLHGLIVDAAGSKWLDVQATQGREDGAALLRLALAATADTLGARYGWDPAAWRWGDHHKVAFDHLIPSDAVSVLGRGPFEYPGFAATLSPAGGRRTTHSASWRVVVDLSQTPPVGYGVYPGGQSGNPFSPLYDDHLEAYLGFEHFRLLKPAQASAMPEDEVASRLSLQPGR